MGKNTSFSIGEHFSAFIETQIRDGRYGNASDVVRAALRLLEEQEEKLVALRAVPASQNPVSEQIDKPAPLSAIDAETKRAARVFLQHLQGKYSVIEMILFGSRARGTHTAESDADIAVVIEGEAGNRAAVVRDMAGIAFDVMMESGILVEPLPLWADELKKPESFSNPALIRNIRRDGLRL